MTCRDVTSQTEFDAAQADGVDCIHVVAGRVVAWDSSSVVASGSSSVVASWPNDCASEVAKHLDGAHLAGVNPAFDAAFLERWLRSHGQAPTWHYHLIDLGAMAYGWLHGREHGWALEQSGRTRADFGGLDAHRTLPWRSDDLAAACGVEPPSDAERHTALGDARWAARWYAQLTGQAVPA